MRGGMAGRAARDFCPQLIFVDGHFRDYQRLGDQALAVLDDYTPLVERISIDEAFADVAGTERLFVTGGDRAAGADARVKAGRVADFGGCGAHQAPRQDRLAGVKPDGLVVVEPAQELDWLHDLPVELMWGVGPATKARLSTAGIFTIGSWRRARGGRSNN